MGTGISDRDESQGKLKYILNGRCCSNVSFVLFVIPSSRIETVMKINKTLIGKC